MISRGRQLSIIYLVLAILGMVFLAATLPGLHFEPGLPIPGSAEQETSFSTQPNLSVENKPAFPWLLQSLLAIGIVLLLIVFLFALFKKASKKRIGLTVAGLALVVVFFLLLPQTPPAQPTSPLVEAPAQPFAEFDYLVAPIGDPPRILFWLIIAGLVFLAACLGTWLLVMAKRQSKNEDLLAREVAAAVQAIAEGQDMKSVIIRCYLQMERIIQQERGIERREAVTPREFERHLTARGIPNAPVRQLTRLFEIARYGNQLLDPQIEQQAVDCLSAIQAACLPNRGETG